MDLVEERFEAPRIENSILEEFKEKVTTLTFFFLLYCCLEAYLISNQGEMMGMKRK